MRNKVMGGSTGFSRSAKFLGAILLAAGSVAASAAPAKDVDTFIDALMKEWDIPGVSVAVVKDDKIIFARGYGVRQAGRPERVDENTSFGIGSVTKSFNATAAAMVVDDGKVGWDKPVIDYIPSLQFSDPWITQHATVRDLAAHRLGIDGFLSYFVRGGDLDSTVRGARYIVPQAAFGAFTYSNTGTTILGKVIENASGQSWDDFVTSRIIRPLGMKNSYSTEYSFIDQANLATCWLCALPAGRPVGIDALKDPSANVSVPHGLVPAGASEAGAEYKLQVLPWRSDRSVFPAGMLHSSARDMAQYVRLHLANGLYQGKRLVSEAQMRQLHSAQVLMTADYYSHYPEGGSTIGYAMGWQTGTYKGRRTVSHGGGRVGYNANVVMFPDDNMGIVVLQNLDYQSAFTAATISLRVADHFLNIPVSRETEQKIIARPKDWKPVSARPAECDATGSGETPSAADIAGKYHSDLLGDAEIVVENGRPALVFEPTSVADLVPARRGSFTACFRGYQPAAYPVRFTYDAANKIIGFVFAEGLHGISPLNPASQAVDYVRVQ
ncbi:serine hydrolase domain-containing protein [Sphingosinicella rhizophila]|uniref:Serine hydrolase domain-containing protein n=1 Tax=Sphingosinicella rhizophila TaxID=3050082 RepID=A0ABU3Q9X1_9SPHN|nr:serine hydrolase domain-containing protein [Sphingosinicella sp. GR2756]MDT9600210.1 serine hydrolase domain-containing protein [Sphingosinicella sp. GR2756]